MQRQAQSAADRLESLLKERDADRTRLTEVQLALQEAMQHLEAMSEAEVSYHFHVPSSTCILVFSSYPHGIILSTHGVPEHASGL